MTKILMRRQQNFLVRFGLSPLHSHNGIDTLKTTTIELKIFLLLFFEKDTLLKWEDIFSPLLLKKLL